jgi:DNA-binding SARP family transcriptional activator
MSQVLFRVLGTLAAERDGCAIALGGSRQRALLALLLVHADEAMSAERLVDELWGEPMPPRAVKRLQVAITRLRQLLSAGGADALLVSDAAGYRLRLAPGQLDADRFGELVAEGRHALEDGQHERAFGTLR